MQDRTKVVVIGGGVVGCSILYHLAKAGWTDVVLLERQELTAGSSWHAAGNLFTLTSPGNAALLQKYTLDLYPELERESDQDCGLNYNGELLIAKDEEEIKTLTIAHAYGLRYGIKSEFISLEKAKELAPTLNTDGILAVLYEPDAGYCDPASVTQAFAKAARQKGAKIHRFTPVSETNQLDDGTWEVVTTKGTIISDYIVNAAGLWAREVAALADIKLPLMPVEHHYLVTDDMPEMESLKQPHALLAYSDVNLYTRPEGKGMLIGTYESKCIHWAEDGTPADFGHELLPNDISRMENELIEACDLIPALGEVGIKRVINGPMIFSPDLEPLIGPYPGKKNYICACGVMTGFNQSAGIGKMLSEWIIDGEPSMDVSFWDVARFGTYAGTEYTRAMTKYWYENRTKRVYPYQQFSIGRPMKTVPIHDQLAASGAVFGETCGWEDPYWFARDNEEAVNKFTYERANWFDAVGEECRALRETAGVIEITSFAKYKFSGKAAYDWLNHLLANTIPTVVGKTALAPMLSPKGKVIGDFTVTRISDDAFLVLGSGSMVHIHCRYFENNLPDCDVTFENLTGRYAGLSVAGPNARAIMTELSAGTDFSSAEFPFLSGRKMELGACPEAYVVRVSYTGELGYEIHMPAEYQRTVFCDLLEIGAHHGLRLVGGHALMSLRLEKGFPAWGLELSSDYFPHETAISRFVRYTKDDFIGKEAAVLANEKGPREIFVIMEVDAVDADCYGGEPIKSGDETVGYTTSGGYGYCCDKSLALGYIFTDHYDVDTSYTIDIITRNVAARVLPEPPIDPNGSRMRE
ncbi:MAG: FAD-dependent oxidoreductase [Gammaproteobacteria bacterium]|nr:FAD-dependent oxidoreductase [Gammaproteobacteria bacterium]